MKQIASVKCTISHMFDEKWNKIAFINAMITMTEDHKDYVGGELKFVPVLTTCDFFMSSQSARGLAERLNEWADKADEESSRITIQKAEESGDE